MREILLHPFQRDHCIELALFQEHRFAFYYWLKWTNNLLTEIPSLISYDWHQDLAPPYKDELEELQELDTTNRAEVALYTWAKLSHFNDVQIRAALLLNKLKDVYVICRQDVGRKAKEEIRDIYGNVHTINIFRSTEAFDAYVPCIEDQKVYLDIDLDFFTFGNPTSGKSPFNTKGYTYMKQAAIKELFSANSETLRWILRRLAGFTIATEPEFCGGLKKSNYFLGILDNIFFTPSLFHRDLRGDGTKWRQEIIDAL
ncbi:hypothetical protein [Desertivirga xinjiangensis]|uniref:hypothetical protein n=1 Tax=Desertivirga xinjiangensis TaxID=539206 RepID=UPI00210DF8E2|nr:hypothetical protein [Pedobacter xinjiangensis]